MNSNWTLIKNVWAYIRPYRGRFWFTTICCALAEGAWLYPPYAFATIVDFFSAYAPGADLSPVYSAFVLTAIAIVVSYAGFYVSGTGMMKLGERAALDVQLAAMRHMTLLDMAWHEKESSGSKFKRIERGSASVTRLLRIWIFDAVDIAISMLGVIAIMLKFDKATGGALIAFLATYWVLRRSFRKRGAAFSDIVNKKEEKRSGMLFEAINNVRSVKIMSMAPVIMKKLDLDAADIFESIKSRIFWFRGGNNISNFYAQAFRVGMLLYIVNGIVGGKYTIGFLVLFSGYFGVIWNAISKLTDISEDFTVAKNSIARMQTILEQPVTIDDERGKVPFPKNWQTISVRNLSFSYQDTRVLSGVSFDVKRGEKIGIVGLSGAGKSTLFKLLLKEYEAPEGEILFDRTPLVKISKRNYFDYLAVVLQDTELFNASLKENVTITNRKEAKNKALFADAVRIAHVTDFMKRLPDGADSVIGEKGVKLSGGEKQRVGIARAIFKKPQIFLLDEATSHLDIESEEKIRDSLHAFFENVTAIVIAHRLTTIKEMDRIIVMEDGRILESGSFAELWKKKGRFFELWEKQNL